MLLLGITPQTLLSLSLLIEDAMEGLLRSCSSMDGQRASSLRALIQLSIYAALVESVT